MSTPLVSIIMPCYNDGRYIREAVASCLAQTYEHIEILIVDDGSDDPFTLSVLPTLTQPGIRHLHTDHLGPAGARNAAIREAKGTYILPVDADDVILPDYVARAVDKLESQPNLGIVYCQAEFFGEKKGPWPLPVFSIGTFLVDNCIFVTSMFRRCDWEQVGGFCEDFKHGFEDYDFWLSILELGREVYQFPDTFFRYRIKKNSRSSRVNTNVEQLTEIYTMLFQRHRKLYEQHIEDYSLTLRKITIHYRALDSQSLFQRVFQLLKKRLHRLISR